MTSVRSIWFPSFLFRLLLRRIIRLLPAHFPLTAGPSACSPPALRACPAARLFARQALLILISLPVEHLHASRLSIFRPARQPLPKFDYVSWMRSSPAIPPSILRSEHDLHRDLHHDQHASGNHYLPGLIPPIIRRQLGRPSGACSGRPEINRPP